MTARQLWLLSQLEEMGPQTGRELDAECRRWAATLLRNGLVECLRCGKLRVYFRTKKGTQAVEQAEKAKGGER